MASAASGAATATPHYPLAARHGQRHCALSRVGTCAWSARRADESDICPKTHLTLAGWGDLQVGAFIKRLRHEGCGGAPKLVELATGIPGSGVQVRRIVLVG
jgi:hypothetical protein